MTETVTGISPHNIIEVDELRRRVFVRMPDGSELNAGFESCKRKWELSRYIVVLSETVGHVTTHKLVRHKGSNADVLATATYTV